MQTEVHREANDAGAQDANACPNCHNLMPNGMRFCRACGCRLGEGVEEYTETVRLDGARSTAGATRTKTAPPPTSTANARDWGNFTARNAGSQAIRTVTSSLNSLNVARSCARVPKWMIWVFLPIIAISIMGGISSNKRRTVRGSAGAASSSSSPSFLGAEYETVEDESAPQGVLIRDTTPPGSAADKAGLIGGDTITSFDGKPVKSEDEMTGLLVNTPVGKTVDVTFIRDGETKTVKLTTISENENSKLREAFTNRPEGQGKLGIDDDDTEVVTVPNANIKGVRLDDVSANLPADIAGVHEGDIVIQFDGTPIRTTEELVTRIHRAIPYSTIKLVVMRGTERIEIPIKVGKR